MIYGYSALEQMKIDQEKRVGRLVIACGLAIFATPCVVITLIALWVA